MNIEQEKLLSDIQIQRIRQTTLIGKLEEKVNPLHPSEEVKSIVKQLKEKTKEIKRLVKEMWKIQKEIKVKEGKVK